MPFQQVEYPCEVKEVFSGDDLIAMVDLGVENLWLKQRVRLSGVDTPNAIKESAHSEAGQLRAYVRALTRGRKGRITVVNRSANSWVAILKVDTPEGEVNVNEYLMEKGYKFKGKVPHG
jgi:hypothetical protein